MNFLQNDTFLTRILSRLIDCILLSILWFLTSIPIVTIGASTTAAYSVALELAFGEHPAIVSGYFASFKKNFFRSTAVFFVLTAIGLFIGLDFWSVLHWETSFQFALEVLILSVGFLYLILAAHAFPALAFYEGRPVRILKIVFFRSLGKGIYTVFVTVLSIFPLLFLARRVADSSFGQWLMLFLLAGNGLICYFNSLHLARLFDPERTKSAGEEDSGE